jgi:hypothetical protein
MLPGRHLTRLDPYVLVTIGPPAPIRCCSGCRPTGSAAMLAEEHDKNAQGI